LQATRKRRVAAGSGTTVQEINQLLKMHRQMADMMKSIGKGKGGLAKMFGMGGGGKMPEPTPEMLEAAKSGQLPQGMKLPGGFGGGGGGFPNLPGLPGSRGFGGGFPGLPGFPGKKK
jgi:signal recognition particle subunit SRP54